MHGSSQWDSPSADLESPEVQHGPTDPSAGAVQQVRFQHPLVVQTKELSARCYNLLPGIDLLASTMQKQQHKRATAS